MTMVRSLWIFTTSSALSLVADCSNIDVPIRSIGFKSIISSFRGCLQDLRNTKGASIGIEPDHHLMLACLRLRIA